MQRQLELAALGLAAAGWLCAVLSRGLALWTVSGSLDNATASLPAYWDGVWLEWDHWDLAHDGRLHCSFYRALVSLSGSFRTWRALVLAAVGAGAFAVAIGGAGAVWFPGRGQVKVFSGVLFMACGVLLLVPTAWACHHSGRPLEGAVPLRRDWGPALYFGWISFALMLAGGGFLATRCPTARDGEAGEPGLGLQGGVGGEGGLPGPGEGAQEGLGAGHPLSRINRTVLTLSQYGRSAEPV